MRIINGRETTVIPLEDAEALTFTEEHHRQGIAVPGKMMKSFGLEKDSELLAVAIFCNPRTRGKQAEYTSELFRLTFKSQVRIRGGASKLIKHYLSTGPWDLFTYQDTAGEATAVYENAGLTLVGKVNPKKSVLVRNGLTRGEAKDNRRDWFSLEQATTYGPDALIGSNLGEIFDEEGKRKSNLRLFTEECGYHLEEIPGDRVYQWRNPEVNFYTYKITSSKDDGYYYGRRAIRGKKITFEQCAQDPYMGSGGKKFQAWVNSVGEDSLKKEIVGIYHDWKEVVAAEKRLIGTSHKDDPRCKNFQPGGTGMTRVPQVYVVKTCEIHGSTIFQGTTCISCKNHSLISLRFCDSHGEVKHRGDSCVKCTAAGHRNLRECSTHGLTIHQASSCMACASDSAFVLGDCSSHGETLFQKNSCLKCRASGLLAERLCPEHGLSIHRGSSCMKCSSGASVAMKNCSIHGEVKHRGNVCMKCSYEALHEEKQCPVHGLSKHVGNTCLKCSTALQFSERNCSIHGMTLHKGGSCTRCTGEKAVGIINCSVHGKTKASAGVCVKCRLSKHLSEELCSIHGVTKHRAGKCAKCSYAATFSEKECEIHGLTKFRGTRCMKCSSAKNWESRRGAEAEGRT